MTATVKHRIALRCRGSLARAAVLYPLLCFDEVEIKFTLKGSNVGQASVSKWNEFAINFNLDYAVANLNTILKDTIHHEVAHIKMFQENDGGHSPGWKKTCIALGGSGEVCHDLPKLFAKGKTYEYVTTTGSLVRITERMHAKVLAGNVYRYSVSEGDIHSACVWRIV